VWITVLLLGVAVNFEPTRIGLVPLLLSRQRPLLQLLTFLICGLAVSLSAGMLILFAAQRAPVAIGGADGGQAQTVIGLLALAAAAIMAASWMRARHHSGRDHPTTNGPARRNLLPHAGAFLGRIQRVLAKGHSPWLAALAGAGSGLPSVDYLAVVAIIAASGAPPLQQAGALVLFVLTGSLVVMAPLVGYLVAPAKTRRMTERLGNWIRSRSRIEYACLLAAAGLMMIALAG
jgi:hypothetical protein